ncbi:hypothetical protein RI129_005880 [Pyrocoelia pectoralis]|uniref:Uncharacterized protein n=1 Tax=Pyrocoelia pectoralis TaxID=417401 RepID=A0AAN7VA77_9COLE
MDKGGGDCKMAIYKVMYCAKPLVFCELVKMDLNKLNDSTFCKSFKNVKDMEVGEKYKVIGIDTINTKYGERIVVETENFKCVLPLRFYDYFKEDDRFEDFKQSLTNNDVFIVSAGTAGKTTNLKFM